MKKRGELIIRTNNLLSVVSIVHTSEYTLIKGVTVSRVTALDPDILPVIFGSLQEALGEENPDFSLLQNVSHVLYGVDKEWVGFGCRIDVRNCQ